MKRISLKHVMHWLIPLRLEHSQIFKLANLLIFLLTFIGCSKKDNNEPVAPSSPVETPAHLKDWVPQPKVDSTQPYMAFATEATAPTLIGLLAVGNTASATDVWVDTNNNGVFDEGVDKRITDFTKPVTFKVTDKVFAVYGKVKELTATGNALTAADVRKNEALTKLNVADNQLSEKALLNLVNSLSTATGTTEVVLRKAEGDGNAVTDAVLYAAKERGWQTLKIEGDKEVADLAPYYIELTTGKTVGEKVDLYMEVNEEDEAGVWLDLNGNGKWDEGIDQKPTEFGENIEYTLQAQTFKVYGKVFFIDCKGNLLSAIDISHNPALTNLDARNNKITSVMYSESLKALYIDSYTLPVSSLPKGLTYLNVKETTPLTTINTSSLTELQVLSAEGCSSLKSLDLSKNEKLTSLHIDGTGLTTLDLSHQPQLTFFYASLTPLTMLNVAGNKALKSVKIQLTQEGEGLQGEALMDFLRQLPTRKKGEEGNIVLNPTQATEEVKSLLTGKFWNVSLVN